MVCESELLQEMSVSTMNRLRKANIFKQVSRDVVALASYGLVHGPGD